MCVGVAAQRWPVCPVSCRVPGSPREPGSAADALLTAPPLPLTQSVRSDLFSCCSKGWWLHSCTGPRFLGTATRGGAGFSPSCFFAL